MIAALSLFLVLSVSAVAATSNADPSIIYNCDATSPLFGCDPAFWVNGNRLNCRNKTNIMSWASKPMRTDCYKVWAGNDEKNPVTQYVPDSYIPIHVDVECYYKMFRGLLLYAVNSSENKVGGWFLPDDDPAWFQQPWGDIPGHTCEKALMHVSADFKPYRNIIRFKAPPAGTGTITFRCLIKQGDANEGAFYLPNLKGDITLKEGKAAANPIDWQLAAKGQSCSDYCKQQGLACDSAALRTLNSQTSFDAQIAGNHPCKLPYLATNDSFVGSYDPQDGFCYYADSSSTGLLSCSSVNPEVSKFCACGLDVLDAAPSMKSSSLFLLPLFLMSPRSALIATLLYLAGSASAHNWLNSISRSTTVASAYSPCKPALSELPHAQVGPNQAFQIEWMTAHGSYTYFAILHSKNADKMKLHTPTLFEDYIKNAPNGSNVALQPKYQKYHYSDTSSLDSAYRNTTHFFSKIVPKDTTYSIVRPNVFGGHVGRINNPTDSQVYQMQYEPAEIANDVRVSYKSDKYPWLEAVYRFELVAFDPTEPDIANFYIPGFEGAGRYIVHYYWRGYRDCFDVDYKTTQVQDIYGIPSNISQWIRIDHCLLTRIMTSYTPTEIVTDAQYCIDYCETRGDLCLGVNVVPLEAPKTAATFKTENGTAWDHPNSPGTDIYVPWYMSGFASTRDSFLNNTSPDKYMCYSVRASVAVSTTADDFVLAASPDDPIFYSTCYYKLVGNMFKDYENYKVEKVDPAWRYGDKCIDCKNQAKNSWLDIVPKWNVPDTCVNCDREPETYVLPPAPEYYQVDTGVRCDGLVGSWQYATHRTCSNDTDCTKRMSVLGRGGSKITLEECQVLVEEDPECGDTYMFHPAGSTSCFCYKKLDCCKTCSRRVDANYDVYELNTKPDPKCSSGVKSADNTACCSAECGAGNCTSSTTSKNVGFCCASCITRSCSQYGPPCKL